jgi:hypothetical protein
MATLPNPRMRLPQLANEQGRSLASLSATIGRNPAYLDERELGARDPWSPSGGDRV